MDFTVCTFIWALLLLATIHSGSSFLCSTLADLAEPCGCTLNKDTFEPVCGSDGNTYLNHCFLNCRETIDTKTIKVLHPGPCTIEEECSCHSEYAPVCGTNGETYSNDCVLNCNSKKNPSIRLKYKGTCKREPSWLRTNIIKTCYCGPGRGPLCGSNGVTYHNYCAMRCVATARNENIRLDYWGPCKQKMKQKHYVVELDWMIYATKAPKKCGCTADQIVYYARCSSRGHIEPTCGCRPLAAPVKVEELCVDEQQSWSNHYSKPSTSDPCVCAAVNSPVCGTNRQTYANICVLHCHEKMDNSVKFLKWGDCEGDVRLISRLKEEDKQLRERRQRDRSRYTRNQ